MPSRDETVDEVFDYVEPDQSDAQHPEQPSPALAQDPDQPSEAVVKSASGDTVRVSVAGFEDVEVSGSGVKVSTEHGLALAAVPSVEVSS